MANVARNIERLTIYETRALRRARRAPRAPLIIVFALVFWVALIAGVNVALDFVEPLLARL